MPDAPPPYLADALSRFRAAADAAVERGRRAADEARAAGTAFQRESDAVAARLRDGRREPRAEPTPPDLRAAAAEYRTANGLSIPDVPEIDEIDEIDDVSGQSTARPRPVPPEDEDFSQFRIMRPL